MVILSEDCSLREAQRTSAVEGSLRSPNHSCRLRESSRETDMSTIRINTSIPGPKSKALSERRAQAVPRGLSHGTPIYVAKAKDAWLEDVDGNRYLDFAGGIGCLNVGHRRG